MFHRYLCLGCLHALIEIIRLFDWAAILKNRLNFEDFNQKLNLTTPLAPDVKGE